ncbi:Fic family protein [Aquirufa sp.]|jgi:Fic family protein|uniref:Fic family protein n=1 Tax=Aquirufa sp. TaxID=2676249 RepID=UPI0037BFE3C9
MPKKRINRDSEIIQFVKDHPQSSSQEILDGLQLPFSVITLRRSLQHLVAQGLLNRIGELKGSRYAVSPGFSVLSPIDLGDYFSQEIDDRTIQASFNLDLIRETFKYLTLFTERESALLQVLQEKHKANTAKLSEEGYKKELERLAIDLSWKSSQIEGNTYSLLETERLLKDKETAAGKTKDEAIMLLNHKEAIDFIIQNPTYINPLTVSSIEDIHSILAKELSISRNIRNSRVGISGTNYTPLDNEYQIREALEQMCQLVNTKQDVFEKALLVLVLISYIQPFTDGNKRTARIISNAILLKNGYCPISFRTIDSLEYKKAMLVFYEQTNIYPFKQIFMGQFEFAVNTYF